MQICQCKCGIITEEWSIGIKRPLYKSEEQTQIITVVLQSLAVWVNCELYKRNVNTLAVIDPNKMDSGRDFKQMIIYYLLQCNFLYDIIWTEV